jgi:endonuclease-3
MKAKHIIAAADVLVKDFSSIVPLTIEELITIPGVGRKSANVIVGRVAHKGAIIVDTHFLRVVNRLGLVETKDPYKIEMSIKKLIDEKRQYRFSMIVNLHGRRVCFARTPSCSDCLLSNVCNYTLNS